MGIYLYNMEMPTSCGECKFFAWKRGVGQHCAVDDRITFHATLDGFDVGYERNGNCPLVPVPPHGRCVDADKLMQEMRLFIKENMLSRDDARELLETIEDAPTVLEAEEET